MNFEKLRQQRTRTLRHMPPRTAFDLRNVRLADALPLLLAHRPPPLLLRHRPVQPAQRAFHFAQVTNFLCQLHISYRNSYIAICNVLSRTQSAAPTITWKYPPERRSFAVCFPPPRRTSMVPVASSRGRSTIQPLTLRRFPWAPFLSH